MTTEKEENITAEESSTNNKKLQVIGWVSVGMAVAALGIVVGRELRNRYKFNRRTPYDFYSNAGEQQSSETLAGKITERFGVVAEVPKLGEIVIL